MVYALTKKIVLINPNSTQAMTDSCQATLHRVKKIDPEKFIFLTNTSGPPAIQGAEDGEHALMGLLELIESNADKQCIIIGCFDDIGLQQARKKYSLPIIGLGQAAYLGALIYSEQFVVLTTLAASVPVIEDAIDNLNLGECCAEVIASGIPVLELEDKPSESIETLNKAIVSINNRYPNLPIVLGCAGMTALYERLQQNHSNIVLIDPVRSAFSLAESTLN